ncbi:hypothetical protein ACIZ62_01155 [Acetobacterium carbinolicum]|uniref:hypothetical protein n=1 Tax=Acetobacterium carbinolicum TaxID=52690 RepID=UPI0039BF0046
MGIRTIEKLKNQQGSSLAFVLIIGMIIMIMVASLLAFANSDFTFTQETVESRQAYIDAKSVIEYGKIAIHEREKKLSDKYDELVAALNDEASTTAEINLIKQAILGLENEITTIYCDEKNVADTLAFSNSGTSTVVGKVFIEKTPTIVGTTDTSKYLFKVETENLRRKLDYQVDYNYVVTTTPGSGGGTFVEPTKPTVPTMPTAPTTNISGWLSTKIMVTSWPTTQCTIATNPTSTFTSTSNVLNVNATGSSLKVDQFNWANNPILNLMADNICFVANMPTSNVEGASFNITATNELRFKGEYKQTYNQSKINKLKARTMIFEGDLIVGSNTGIDIECDTLWIKGDLIIDTNNNNIINRIKAKNIIIENVSNQKKGNLTINGASSVVWEDLENLWIEGDLNLNSWTAGKIDNKITADNIIIFNTKNKKNGSLNVTSHSKLEIVCNETFLAGKVSIAANNNSLISTIKAKDIVIEDIANNKGGSVVIGDKTTVVWDAVNFWLDGDITTKSTNAQVTFQNINYLNTDNINLDHLSQLKIKGAENKKNHLIIGTIKAVNSNNVHIDISNICSIECDGIDLNWNSSLKIDAGKIEIKGDFRLVQAKSPLELTCEYFDCLGETEIYRLQSELNFYPKNEVLNLRFNGGYEQVNSVVNINGAQKVIFGNYDHNSGGGNDEKITLIQDNPHTLKLNVKSDAIYLNANSIAIPGNADFYYAGKSGGGSNIFNIKTSTLNKVGNYSNVTGNKIEELPGTGELPYTPPTWPDPLNCSCEGSANSTIDISPGTEKYY